MKDYKKVYAQFFDISTTGDEPILSELGGGVAVDIHHIYPKMMGGRKSFIHEGCEYGINDIANLIALTREEHNDAHSGMYTKKYLFDVHRKRINAYLRSIQ